jgi:hypothetical protein
VYPPSRKHRQRARRAWFGNCKPKRVWKRRHGGRLDAAIDMMLHFYISQLNYTEQQQYTRIHHGATP